MILSPNLIDTNIGLSSLSKDDFDSVKISGKYSLPLLGAYLRENQFIGKDGFSRGFFVEIIGNEFIECIRISQLFVYFPKKKCPNRISFHHRIK